MLALSVSWNGSFFFGAGAARDLPPVTIVCGQHTIGAGLAAILNVTTPLLTAQLAHAFGPGMG